MLSVWDLRDYARCKRCLWLRKKAGIKKPNVGFVQGRRFHSVIHNIFDQISSVLVRQDIPGVLVDTEVWLEYGGLRGRIDYLRRTDEGYIIQDEKYCEPPKEGGVFEADKLQVNAYAYLAQNCGYVPIKGLYVVYNDLRPRELKPEPQIIPPLVEEINDFLQRASVLPEAGNGESCATCLYFPLCQLLPESGGIGAEHLRALKRIVTNSKLLNDLEASCYRGTNAQT